LLKTGNFTTYHENGVVGVNAIFRQLRNLIGTSIWQDTIELNREGPSTCTKYLSLLFW